MIPFIAHHPLTALALVFVGSLILALFVGGICAAAGRADVARELIEPGELSDPVCSWCQFEQAVKAQPHESHGICQRHKEQMLAEAKRLNHAA